MSREIVASKPCIELKLYRKIYSSVDSLYAWLYNETKQKNCLFDEALCHIGYNKLNEEFWTGEGREWFRWIYKYEGEDIAGSDISSIKVERRPVLKVGGHLQISRNWRVCLQLKAKSVKVKGRGANRRREESAKWYDYLYLSNSTIRNAGIGLFAARELPSRTLIGYYCGVLLWRSGQMLPYDEHLVIEPPDEKTDAYTILMRDSKGEWVTVSPGGCGEPSLYMGFQFMNNIGLSFDDEMENQSRVCQVMYNTQITEDGCVYTTRMIAKGTELLCPYVQERMIPEQEQENFVEGCARRVQARYGETKAKKKFVALRDKYGREGDGDRKRRARGEQSDSERKRRARTKPTEVKRKLESAVGMRELSREEQVSRRRLSRIAEEKKSVRLLKVARKASSDSESFEALETAPKMKFSVEDESLESEPKIKFSVESSVTSVESSASSAHSSVTPSGTETYDSDRVSLTELLG